MTKKNSNDSTSVQPTHNEKVTSHDDYLHDDSSRKRSSRRRFTKTLTAAFAAAPFAVSIINAQTTPAPTTTKQSPAPPNPQPSPTPAAQTAQQPSPLAAAYTQVARVRFGDRLTNEEFARVKTDLTFNVRTADRLRAFKLKNADEPDFIFSA